MVGLSAQQVLRQRMDTTANNLANMTTTGFKTEKLVMRPLSERPAAASDSPSEISFVDSWRLQRDFSTGPIEQTGNPLDAAIEGDGFFTVQTPEGPAYTRDGQFALGPGGQLVTRAGYPVLAGGGPLAVDPMAGEVEIGADGSVLQAGAPLGQFDIVTFPNPTALEKRGDNLWKATDEPPAAAQGYRIVGRALEGSNVNAIAEITQMIGVSRAYESVSKMIVQADDLRASSIDKLSRVG